MITANGNALFTKKQLDELMALPRVRFMHDVGVIFVAVDPSAGSLDKSRYSLSAMTIGSGGAFVVRCCCCCARCEA